MGVSFVLSDSEVIDVQVGKTFKVQLHHLWEPYLNKSPWKAELTNLPLLKPWPSLCKTKGLSFYSTALFSPSSC